MKRPNRREHHEKGSLGVAIMAAWLAGDGEHAKIINDVIRDGGADSLSAVITGLIGVSGLLLVKLSDATGVKPAEILRDCSATFAEGGPDRRP